MKEMPHLLKAQVLEASHHGAGSTKKEQCNDEDWIKAVTPQIVILSSGINREFLHPKASTISRFEAELQDIPNNFHVLFAGIEKGSKDTDVILYGVIPDHYGILITQKNIFSTLNHGDISCSWGNNADELPKLTFSEGKYTSAIANNDPVRFSDRAICLLKTLLHPCPFFENLRELFALNNLTLINLSNLHLTDVVGDHRSLVLQLCDKLLAGECKLKKLMLGNNSFQLDGEIIKRVIEVVDKRLSIRYLDISNNNPPIPPDVDNPDVDNPDVDNPDVDNPDVDNPDVDNPDVDNYSIRAALKAAWRQRGLILQ
jgi:hypothetical protein